MGREPKMKYGGGGGEGRNRLQTNPWILKTSVRQRTELVIGWASRNLLTSVNQIGLSPLLSARKKWNWYVYIKRSLFSPNKDFVMSFDNTVEILWCIADASVFRSLHTIAEARSTQFAAVPWILTSTAFVNTTYAKDKIILKTTGQKTRTTVGKPSDFIWLFT